MENQNDKGTNLPSITLVLDESGAKGYSDNRERTKGELGVVAGFILPTERLQNASQQIENIIRPFQIDGKLHITDLSPENQEAFRQEIFKYLQSVNARWVYEAMYVEGLHSYAAFMKVLNDKAKANQRSTVKVSGNVDKDLLHSELLLGAFSKAIAFGIDYISDEFHINVITDQLDASIVKSFQQDAINLLNLGEEKERKVTGFDPITRQIVEGKITTQIKNYKDVLGDFSGITFEITTSNNPLTIVADVISNSVCYHLSQLQTDNPGCQLNTFEAIAGYQLASLVYGVTGQETEGLQVADTIFQYPR